MTSKNILFRRFKLSYKFSSHLKKLEYNMHVNFSLVCTKLPNNCSSINNLTYNKLSYLGKIMRNEQYNYSRLFSTGTCHFGNKRGYDNDSGYFDDAEVNLKPSLKAKNVIRIPGGRFEKFQEQGAKIDKKERYVDDYKENTSQKRKRFNHGLTGKGTYEHKMSKQTKVPGVKGEILYGLYPVLYALQQKVRMCHCLYVKEQKLFSAQNDPDSSNIFKEILQVANTNGVEIVPCKAKQLTLMSGDRPHQGVCLDASPKEYENFENDSSMLKKSAGKDNCKLWLYLEAVKDTMNFGAILRSSYYLGVEKILCSREDSCGLTPVVSKASSGVLELIPIYSVTDLPSLIEKVKGNGWSVFGTTPPSEENEKVKSIHNVTLTKPTLLFLGNEGHGLSDDTLDLCDTLLTIKPRSDLGRQVESLNVSVATGIILHHLIGKKN